MLRFGLRPGDPAAVFDVETNTISWLAINDYEKTQVGRYYHLKKDYQKAWEWYEQGKHAGAPAPQALAATGLPAANEQLFYDYLCLTQLGKSVEAADRRKQFETVFLPSRKEEASVGSAQQQSLAALADRMELVRALMHDFLIAEVYLSIDAADDAEKFFQSALKAATTDDQRLSCLLVLSQILLIEGKHEAYLELCVNKLGPHYAKDKQEHARTNSTDNMLIDFMASSALTPLLGSEFLKDLSPATVQRMLPAWRSLVASTPSSPAMPILELALVGLLDRAGDRPASGELRRRLTLSGACPPNLQPSQGDWRKSIQTYRDQLRQFLTGF